jgi:hypothetical protein
MLAGHWIASFTPVLLMMCIIGSNHLINILRTDRKAATEASRLRFALAAELRAMVDLYNANLQLIEQKADYILSSRSSVLVYRGNLGRMTILLEAPLIEQIVRVFAQNERIEAVLSAHANFKCNLTYQFKPADANFEEWKNMIKLASIDIVAVCRMLEGCNRASAPATATVSWPNMFDRLVQQTRL